MSPLHAPVAFAADIHARHRAWQFALAPIVALSLAGTASAQSLAPSPPATSSGDAERLYTQGVEALDRADFGQAVRRLRQSYALHARPIVLLNIAQALRGAGRTVDAIQSYLDYLRVGGPSLSAERVSMVRATVDFLSASLASLTVTSRPPGAEVRVDGTSVGRTPLTEGMMFPAGDHTVELDLEGFVIVRENVHLTGRQRRTMTFRMAEQATAATLTVAVPPPVPSAASIYLDGIDLGRPDVTRSVSAGGHRVEVRAPGFDPFDEELLLAPRQRRSLSVHLQPSAPLLARPWFWVVFGVVVAGAAVTTAVLLQETADPASRPNTPVITIMDPMTR